MMWIREKEVTCQIKNNGDKFSWKKNMKTGGKK